MTKKDDSLNINKSTVRNLAIVVLVAVIVVLVFRGRSTDADVAGNNIPDVVPLPGQARIPSISLSMSELIEDDDIKGDDNAGITIVEFSDFECPYCARFYAQGYQEIETNYIDTGKAKLIFRDYPLSFHKQAQKAAEAAECAGDQGQYYPMHDKLFAEGVEGGVSQFKGYAEDLGLDMDEFSTCIDGDKYKSEPAVDMADGQKVGVTGTPGFIIFPTGGISSSNEFSEMIPLQYENNIEVIKLKDTYAFKVKGALPYSAFAPIFEGILLLK